MTETIARRDDPPVPLLMPVLLSLVAGYLDSYTYLSLFGLVAAQVTGSFVIAGDRRLCHGRSHDRRVLHCGARRAPRPAAVDARP